MIQWFKDGKALPKRYVWEIVLGAYKHFQQEPSLVDVELADGVTCDVIGDVHGMYLLLLPMTADTHTIAKVNFMTCYIYMG